MGLLITSLIKNSTELEVKQNFVALQNRVKAAALNEDVWIDTVSTIPDIQCIRKMDDATPDCEYNPAVPVVVNQNGVPTQTYDVRLRRIGPGQTAADPETFIFNESGGGRGYSTDGSPCNNFPSANCPVELVNQLIFFCPGSVPLAAGTLCDSYQFRSQIRADGAFVTQNSRLAKINFSQLSIASFRTSNFVPKIAPPGPGPGSGGGSGGGTTGGGTEGGTTGGGTEGGTTGGGTEGGTTGGGTEGGTTGGGTEGGTTGGGTEGGTTGGGTEGGTTGGGTEGGTTGGGTEGGTTGGGTEGGTTGGGTAIAALPQKLTLGTYHGCYIDNADRAYCWGKLSDVSSTVNFSPNADGSTALASTPIQVAGNFTDWDYFAAGAGTSCGIRNGRLYCWGENDHGQLGIGNTTNQSTLVEVSGSHTDWTAVAVSKSHDVESTCGLRSGAAYCWGTDNKEGTIGDGIDGGTPGACWNGPDLYTTPHPVAGGINDFIKLASAYKTYCGLRQNGEIWCWGDNYQGELGIGSHTDACEPTKISSPYNDWVDIGAGIHSACGLRANGDIYCWGRGVGGRLGNGALTEQTSPVKVLGGHNFDHLAVGYDTACGITTSGQAHCWGMEWHGRLGNGVHAWNPQSTPVAVAGGISDFTDIALGSETGCAKRSNDCIFCWGLNDYNQIGLSGTGYYTSPQQMACLSPTTPPPPPPPPSTPAIVEIAAVGAGTLMTRFSNGEAKCRGDNSDRQCGIDSTNDEINTATNIVNSSGNPITNVEKLMENSSSHICVATATNVMCAGENSRGDLGNIAGGPHPQSSYPLSNPTQRVFVDVATSMSPPFSILQGGSGGFNWAKDSTGQSYFWGQNRGYRGSQNDYQSLFTQPTPVNIPFDSQLTDVANGSHHSCGIFSDKTVGCWGSNSVGELGRGSTSGYWKPNSTPPKVVTSSGVLSNISQVVAGIYFSCALQDGTGEVYCWGANSDGQLGHNNTTNSSVAKPVIKSSGARLSGIKQIDVGFRHVCGVATNGGVYCWGNNEYNQVSTSGSDKILYASQISGCPTMETVSSGNYFNCSLNSSGDVYCWGDNRKSPMGNIGTNVQSTPLKLSF